MSFYKVPDVFIKKQDERYIIFSPLVGKISVVNKEFVDHYSTYLKNNFNEIPPALSKNFINAGLISENIVQRVESEKTQFTPTEVTFFPTTNCNLRCLYCYAEAGELENRYLDVDIAKNAIDFIIQNAKNLNKEQIGLSFHGGGEPTYKWDFIVEVVEYAKILSQKENLNIYSAIATNGILSTNKIDWIIENFDEVMLSWDGPEDIQNRNRPLKNGEGSFQYLLNTALRFLEVDYHFGVRATITSESVMRLKEIFYFFAELGIKSIGLEPLYECGRCIKSGLHSPKPEVFVNNFLPLISYAKDMGVSLENSLAPLSSIRNVFCGAVGSNFCITPEGYISSCFEVSLLSDQRSQDFFYGKFNPDEEIFEINNQQRDALFSRQLTNMIGCEDCQAKWQCGGECLAKASSDGDLFTIIPENNTRCIMQKMMLEAKIDLFIGDE